MINQLKNRKRNNSIEQKPDNYKNKEKEIIKLINEIAAMKREHERIIKAKSLESIKTLEKLNNLNKELEKVKKELSIKADYEKIKKELNSFKAIELDTNGDNNNSDINTGLIKKNRNLNDQNTKLRNKISELESKIESLDHGLKSEKELIKSQKQIIKSLETQIHSNSNITKEHQILNIRNDDVTKNASNKTLEIIRSQRDRYRNRNEELEFELQNLYSLNNENINLTKNASHKTVNIDTYNDSLRKRSGNIKDNSKKTNKFFKNIDKASIYILRIFASNQKTRILLIMYFVSMHVLFLFITYYISHHSNSLEAETGD